MTRDTRGLLLVAVVMLPACMVGVERSERVAGSIDRSMCGPDIGLECEDPLCITCFPADESQWDIVGLVQRFQQASAVADPAAWWEIQNATLDQLWPPLGGAASVHFVQPASDEVPETAVEITSGLIPVPYADLKDSSFIADWGQHLAGRIGGEVVPYDPDAEGRDRQVERMVLGPLPLPISFGKLDNDMTKVEVIEYEEEAATVYWRVVFSDNGTTEVDVGSVRFESYEHVELDGLASPWTRVTFHSGHRLTTPRGKHIESMLVAPLLSVAFRNHVQQYRIETAF